MSNDLWYEHKNFDKSTSRGKIPYRLIVNHIANHNLINSLVNEYSRTSQMRPVSRVNSRRSVVGGVTCRNTPISRPTLEKNPMPGHLFEGNPVDEGTKRRVTDTPVHHSVKAAGSTHSSTRGLSSHEQLERQAEFHSSTQDEA